MSNVERVYRVEAVQTEIAGGGVGSSGGRPNQQSDPSRYRLVIEEGAQPGSFVYKTLDRLTGEIIRQLPREEVLKLRERSVRTGSVIDTAV